MSDQESPAPQRRRRINPIVSTLVASIVLLGGAYALPSIAPGVNALVGGLLPDGWFQEEVVRANKKNFENDGESVPLFYEPSATITSVSPSAAVPTPAE